MTNEMDYFLIFQVRDNFFTSWHHPGNKSLSDLNTAVKDDGVAGVGGDVGGVAHRRGRVGGEGGGRGKEGDQRRRRR